MLSENSSLLGREGIFSSNNSVLYFTFFGVNMPDLSKVKYFKLEYEYKEVTLENKYLLCKLNTFFQQYMIN